MNWLSGMAGYNNPLHPRWSQADLIRSWVIAAFILSITGLAYLSMSMGYGTIVPQLFYFPILYTAYFYPARSIYVACSCGIAYSFVAAYFAAPDLVIMAGIIIQVLLFIGIAAASGIVLKNREHRSPAFSGNDAEAVRVMIAAGESDQIEFKLRSLWSADLLREAILSSESAEVRKYHTNASKFIIARSIAGFLNTGGGDLIIGIRENRINNTIEVTGIEEDYLKMHIEDRNPDGYRRMLVDAIIRKYLPEVFESVSKLIHFSFPALSGRTICHVHIIPSEKPVFVDINNEELFFIRVDASTRSITGKALTQYILTRFSSP